MWKRILSQRITWLLAALLALALLLVIVHCDVDHAVRTQARPDPSRPTTPGGR